MKRLCLVLVLVAGVFAGALSGPQASATSWAYLYLKVGGVGGTVAANPPGYIMDPSCPDQMCRLAYPEGTVVTLSPGGSRFVSWYRVPGTADPRCGGVVVCRTTISGTMGIEAAFSPVELNVDSTYGGWVDIETEGDGCGGGCSRYSYGARAWIHAHAIEGYSFSHWSGGCRGIGESCRVSMNDNRSLYAIFDCNLDYCKTKQPVTSSVAINVVTHGPGSASYRGITCRGSCSRSAMKRELVSIEAKPDAGGSFAGWTSSSVSCGGSGNRCSFPAFKDAYARNPTIHVWFR